jgi:hypothetical protein
MYGNKSLFTGSKQRNQHSILNKLFFTPFLRESKGARFLYQYCSFTFLFYRLEVSFVKMPGKYTTIISPLSLSRSLRFPAEIQTADAHLRSGIG